MKSVRKNIIVLIIGVLLLSLTISCGNDDSSEKIKERIPAPPEDIAGTYRVEAKYRSTTCGQEIEEGFNNSSHNEFYFSVVQDSPDKSIATIIDIECSDDDCVFNGFVEGNTLVFEVTESEIEDGCSINRNGKFTVEINDDQVSGDLKVYISSGSNWPASLDCEVNFDLNGTKFYSLNGIDGTYELSAILENSSCSQNIIDELKKIEGKTSTVNISKYPQNANKAMFVIIDCSEDCVYEAEVDGTTVIIEDSNDVVFSGCNISFDGEFNIKIDDGLVSGYMDFDLGFQENCNSYEDCNAHFRINGKRI